MKAPIRVLIVDDRVLTRDALKSSLLRYEYELVQASTGAEALKLMAANEFDISFIDLRLPDMSGIDILKVARKRRHPIGLPVIMTGEPKPSTPDEAKTLGAKFMQKPLDLKDIRAVIHQAAPDAKPTAPPIVLPNVPKSRQPAERLPRLLVLDDNEAWLALVKRELGNDFHLELTTSPKDAIESVAEKDYELVILDMRLPGTDGVEVLRRMREFAPDVGAVILTAFAEDEDNYKHATRAGNLKAIEYVIKKDGATLARKIKEIREQNPGKKRVFFCYAHTDEEQVAYYYERLTNRGFDVFRDNENIIAGERWKLAISDAIHNANRFVYFLSRNTYNRSGQMRIEINLALQRQEEFPKSSIFFVPARLEECGIDKDVEQFQRVDLFGPKGFERLLEALTKE